MLAAAAVLADLSKSTYVPAVEISALYRMGGDVDTAVNWLEIAYDQHDPSLPHIGVAPFFGGTGPGYHDLLRRMNLARWIEE